MKRGLGGIKSKHVHILRDGHMRQSPGYSSIHAISIITEGFRLPDEALRAIYEYVQKYAEK